MTMTNRSNQRKLNGLQLLFTSLLLYMEIENVFGKISLGFITTGAKFTMKSEQRVNGRRESRHRTESRANL